MMAAVKLFQGQHGPREVSRAVDRCYLCGRSGLSSSHRLGPRAGPWQMHDWMGWGWGGMWLGPLFMLIPLTLLIAAIVLLVRWMGGGSGNGGGRVRTARDILDERYARGEIDREEYQRRRDDIRGTP